MTNKQFARKEQKELSKVPEEFRGVISHMAYEAGHSAGYEEVLNYVAEYVFKLSPAIKEFRKNLQSGRRCMQCCTELTETEHRMGNGYCYDCHLKFDQE